MQLNLEVFKEPKGFIRILQLLFVLITIISICSFGGEMSFKGCLNATARISYPFSSVNVISGGRSDNAQIPLSGRAESTSQFCVFVAGVSLIYCASALVIYTVFEDFIYRDQKIRKADFVIGAVLSFLWLVIAIAWSDAVRTLSKLVSNIDPRENSTLPCTVDFTRLPYTAAYVGIIACFTGFGLFLSGLWFLWKETAWFQHANKSDSSHNAYVSNDNGDHNAGAQQPQSQYSSNKPYY